MLPAALHCRERPPHVVPSAVSCQFMCPTGAPPSHPAGEAPPARLVHPHVGPPPPHPIPTHPIPRSSASPWTLWWTLPSSPWPREVATGAAALVASAARAILTCDLSRLPVPA